MDSAASSSRSAKRAERKFQPYKLTKEAATNKAERPSKAEMTNYLLSTLQDEGNPICHSDIADRSMPMFSTSTGHQVAEGIVNRRRYFTERTAKIKVQAADAIGPKEPPSLSTTRCYINGYLEGTTDLEMKRVIAEAGGTVLPVASSATHIITSQPLSGSKNHKILTAKKQSRNPFVVKPEWVMDSVKAGKRLSEREYAVITETGSKNVFTMLQKK
uniref:BRCT domain-containing protein n=1 Tax=Mycena chlorophos TaxID=658473 RepID=A0ABQ0M9G0_MYCCL|nr:predicted protein [Mycena chlorophos]